MSEVATKELPENWVWTTLGEVFNWGSGGTPKRTNPAYYDGDIPWLIIRDLNDGPVGDSATKINEEGLNNSSAKWVEPGSVLVAMYGSIGKLGIATERLTTNQAIAFTKPEGNDAKYLFYYLMLSRSALLQQGKGIAQKNISQTVLKAFPFPLAPLEQQKRIVAKIEELFSHIDAGIEALKKAKQLLKQYRQSVLKAAVTGELTKEWREANKDKLEPASQLLERILKERRQKWEEQQLEQFKTKGKMPKNDKWKEKYKTPVDLKDWSFLCELPKSWVWSSVDQIGNPNDQAVLTGPFGSNLGKKDFISSGVPVLTIGCLKESGIILTKAMHVSTKKAVELERYKLKDGDMLFSRMAAVGRAGHIDKKLEGCLFNYHIMRLRLHDEAILQDYFVHYVRGSSQVYEYVKEVNHGATRDGINTQQLLEMPVVLPPLDEQYQICRVVKEKLDLIRCLDIDIDQQLKKAEKNKQSILASSFSGEIING